MTVIQGTYVPQLGGVSQQVYTDRQTTQVEAQVNMTSDTVRGLRKRAGTRLALDVSSNDLNTWSLGNTGHLRQYTANLGWGITSFVVNTLTGVVTSIVEDKHMSTVGQSDYLIAPDPVDIVFTTVGSTLYIGNCDVYPVGVTDETRLDPALRGYFFVLAGAYGKVFSMDISCASGSFSVSYTTPEASATDAAKQSTGDYICEQLVTQINAAIAGNPWVDFVVRTGTYIYIQIKPGNGELSVATPTGTTYAVASNTHTQDLTSKLPAQLPEAANGFIMSIGDTNSWQYYAWEYDQRRWLECGAYGSPTGIDASTMPLAVVSSDTENEHEFSDITWLGRNAGDQENNETPAFLDDSGVGITGISSFQGRLIIFSGPYISMGSSAVDYRYSFYRTTVSQVLDADRIEFTSTSFSGAVFRHGIPFNSDLILASDQHQGVIPGRNQVLTPNNATAVLTSAYQCDTDVAPLAAGRSLYYAYPRSNSSFAVKEMLPSGYTDLQYTSQDVTEHLPTYLEGAPSFITASTTNNIVVFGSRAELDTLYVNEYLWSGDQKVLSSWHKWVLEDCTIHAAWFIREVLYLLVERDNNMRMLSMSLRDSPDISDAARYLPALDCCVKMTVTNPNSNEPYIDFAASGTEYMLWQSIVNEFSSGNVATVTLTGAYIGAEVGIRSIDTTSRRLHLQPGYGATTLYVGLRYTAKFSPTPPRILDNNGNYVDITKLVIQFYNFTFRYTTEFTVNAYDRGGTVWDDTSTPAISYSSTELSTQQAALDDRYHLKLRVGMEAESSSLELVSNSVGDLNIQGMGYILKFNNRIRRM